MPKKRFIHTISIVIPVYGGEKTLNAVVGELLPYRETTISAHGHAYRIKEILLSWDHGRDRSDVTIRALEEMYPSFVRGVWLSRNYGQHPATMAGISCTTSDWVVTMDEDGQHDSADIGRMLDVALQQQADVVYADPKGSLAQSAFRTATSHLAKFISKSLMGSADAEKYQSFRLILGNVARSLATLSGNDVYLDVALGWVANKVAQCPVKYRDDENRPSTYNLSRLIGHFWRMIVTGGTRPLRIVSTVGALIAAGGFIWATVLFFMQLITHAVTVAGWTSTMMIQLIIGGLIMSSIGVVAEYIGINVRAAMGKPLYLVSYDPAKGPLGEGGHAPDLPQE